MNPFEDPIPSTSTASDMDLCQDRLSNIENVLMMWDDPLLPVHEEVIIESNPISDAELFGILQGDSDARLEDYVEDEVPMDYTAEPDEGRYVEHRREVNEQMNWRMGNPPPEEQNSFQFQGNPGLNLRLGNEPIDYFRAIMTSNFLETFLKCTNEYGNKLKSQSVPQTRAAAWKELDMQELLLFLGLLFHMGFVKINRLVDYWKKDIFFNQKIFATKMSRNRFLQILRMINVQTVTSNVSYDKVKYIIEFLNNRMLEIYYPTEHIAVDESMMLWRGRLNFRQYVKGKRHQHGLKFYVLADELGVATQIHLYAGAADTIVGGAGHVDKVILHLIQCFKDMGHSLYTDNFYTSVELAEKLLTLQVYSTGTLNLNRKGIPLEIKQSKLKPGELAIMNKNGLCVIAWKDKRQILALSNKYNAELMTVTNRRGQLKNKPKLVAMYTKYMKPIDHHDQMLAYYTCEHKSLRWYKKVIIHLMEVMMVNAFLLYKKYCKHMNFYDFKLSVVKSIVPHEELDLMLPLGTRVHLPEHLPRGADGRTKRKRCVQCWASKKKKSAFTLLLQSMQHKTRALPRMF